jgi:hypothetical protein
MPAFRHVAHSASRTRDSAAPAADLFPDLAPHRALPPLLSQERRLPPIDVTPVAASAPVIAMLGNPVAPVIRPRAKNAPVNMFHMAPGSAAEDYAADDEGQRQGFGVEMDELRNG